MNTSQKCNCCLKESVCKYKTEYVLSVEKIKVAIIGRTTEVKITCKEFLSHRTMRNAVEEGKEDGTL